MEIILLERVEKLGQMGDVVKVKSGYARNFLLPQGKALRANKANLERFETEKAQREADNLSRRSDAETEAGKMDGLAVSMVRAASEMGQLFGSVTSRDIANAVTEAGYTLGRSQVIMETAIKTLGLHDIRVRLHPEVTVTVVVNVARSLDEAETQLKTGVAVTGMIDDDDDGGRSNARVGRPRRRRRTGTGGASARVPRVGVGVRIRIRARGGGDVQGDGSRV